MTNDYPYDLWLSVGSDAGISFASVGRLAKDSSMMQGILLSLQNLMTTEVDAGESQFMTGQNEFVRFGTFTMTKEEVNIIVQYIVKADKSNSISVTDENIVQELALAFGKFIMLTPNFYQNVEDGRTVSMDFVAKSYLNACTIAKQKTAVKENNKELFIAIEKEINNAIEDSDDYETLNQLKNLQAWFGEEEGSWEKGSISSFKRQLIMQMFSQDILNHLTKSHPFAILQYQDPRYAIEEISNKIELFLKKNSPKPKNLIEKYLGDKLEKKVLTYLHELNIHQLHTADSFIADCLTKEIVLEIAKERPIYGLIDFRDAKLYQELQKEVGKYCDPIIQGNYICDSLVEEIPPLVLQGTRLFFHQLIVSFKGRELPPSVWSVITDFSFAIIKEESLEEKKKKKKKKSKKEKSALELKKEFITSRIEKLSNIEKKWKQELIEIFNKSGLGERLEISNIEESVLFAKSLERAIISTLEKMVEDQFLNSKLGSIFLYVINAFKDFIPKHTFSNLLAKTIQDLRTRELEIEKQLSITARDLIGGGLETGNLKGYVNSVPVVFKKRLFRSPILKFDGRTISINELLVKPGLHIQYDNKIYPLNEIESDAEILASCLVNPKVLRKSYEISIIRKMMSSYSEKMFRFEGNILAKIDNLITIFQKEKVTKLRNVNLIPEVKESFPSFPEINEIPNKFQNKDYHKDIQETWNKYAPKLHKSIQELLSEFANLKSNSLHYKKNAMKLYDKSSKELKKHRKKLIKSWDKVNKKITKEIEEWAKEISSDVDPHVAKVKNNYRKWIDDAFYIDKIEPNKFTPSVNECKKLIENNITVLKEREIGELPKNFVEIALSILLYRRIPDYVIDDSYNQMIQDAKSATLSVRKAWIKSESRKEFENNLYINMRVLGNTLVKLINSYIRIIHQTFIQRDLELMNDRNGFYLELGEVPKEIYTTKSEVNSIMRFPNIDIVSSGKNWLIKYYIEPDYFEEMNENQDRLVVISDIIRFVARSKLEENTEQLIEGIKTTTNYLLEQGDKRVIDLVETMKEAIFKLSDYPSISAVDQQEESELAF